MFNIVYDCSMFLHRKKKGKKNVYIELYPRTSLIAIEDNGSLQNVYLKKK